MENEMTVYETHDVEVRREPAIVLEEAKRAARALKDVVSQKAKPVIFNGEQYLEFEDLQTLGRFYGVTAKIVSTMFIQYGEAQGFEARAIAIRGDGSEISAAEAMCMNDENNWKAKPLFQLRSMSQTRACAKALRNVLAWVVVLAGYKPTPAEEMTGNEHKPPIQEPQKKNGKAPEAPPAKEDDLISEPQRKRFYAIAKSTKVTDDQIKEWLFREYDIEHSKDIPRNLYDEICERVKKDLSGEPGSEG
jgi:hypothetical protein